MKVPENQRLQAAAEGVNTIVPWGTEAREPTAVETSFFASDWSYHHED
jgi:phosphoribosylformylglycinamidine (FGAM) synthase-like enzyme